MDRWAGIGRLVELSQSCPRGATGKPVGMDIARRGGDPVHKGLMARNGILVRVDTQGVGNRLKHFLAPRHGDQSGKHSRASAHIFSVESRQQPLNVRST